LLMLARLEDPRRWGQPASRLDAVLGQALADLSPEERSRLSVAPHDGSLSVPVPEALAAVALRNLIDNALRYTPADQTVALAVHADSTGVALTVRDLGTQGAEPEARGGHGLGLVI